MGRGRVVEWKGTKAVATFRIVPHAGAGWGGGGSLSTQRMDLTLDQKAAELSEGGYLL